MVQKFRHALLVPVETKKFNAIHKSFSVPLGNALSPEGGGGYGETPLFFWGALLHLLRVACGLDELEP